MFSKCFSVCVCTFTYKYKYKYRDIYTDPRLFSRTEVSKMWKKYGKKKLLFLINLFYHNLKII